MPVWLRRMARRRSASIAAWASWPGDELALLDPGDVAAQAGQGVGGVEHLGAAGRRRDGAGVADLAARLGVEGRAVGEDLDRPRVRAVGGGDRHDGQDAHVALVVAVAEELGRAELLDQLAVAVDAVVVHAARLPRLLGPPALLGHLDVEAVDVDLDAPLGR